MNSVERGAISELAVAIDLMWRDYEVFRPLCAAASCDLITLKDSKTLRVEVKTGKKIRSVKKADIVAIPMEGFIAYYPPLPSPPPTYPL